MLYSGLMPLIGISYDYTDKWLILEFVEKWHFKTNNFHLLVGKMIVTLDDMSSLHHLLIVGQFYEIEPLVGSEEEPFASGSSPIF